MGNVEVKTRIETPETKLQKKLEKNKDCEKLRKDLYKILKADKELEDSKVPQDQLLRASATPLITMLIVSNSFDTSCDISDIKKEFEIK